MKQNSLNSEKVYINDMYSLENGTTTAALDNDEILTRIYEDNYDKFENISKIIKYTQIFIYSSGFLFFIILIIKLSSKGNFNWLYLSFPFFIFLLSIIILLNCFLHLKNLMDKIENNLNSNNFGTIFTFIIGNLIGLFLSIFFIILMLRLDMKILVNNDLNLIMIPLYVSLGLGLLFCIFISPSFFSNGLYFEIILYFIDLISCLIFICLICLKFNSSINLSKNNKLKYFHCFIIFYLAIFSHLIYSIFKCLNYFSDKIKNNNFIKEFSDFFMLSGLVFLLLTGLITQLKLDNYINNSNHYIQAILCLISFILLYADNIQSLFNNDDIEE